MAAPPLSITVLGSGTSVGVPTIGCHCAVCSSSDPRDNRLRPSVYVKYRGRGVLIDTTPDFRQQALRAKIERVDAILLTHSHADHVMGLDDVRRFNLLNGQKPIDVWADANTHESLERMFAYAFLPAHEGPRVFRPLLNRRIIEGPFQVGSKRWTPIPLKHGHHAVLGFRVGRLAYCTDVSRIPDDSWSLLRDLDVLVLDALQYKKHPTHFNIEEAIDAAQRIGAGQTIFTHITHALPHQQTNASLPRGIRLAFDGERVIANAR